MYYFVADEDPTAVRVLRVCVTVHKKHVAVSLMLCMR